MLIMSEVCKNLIEDYIEGTISHADLQQSLQSLFQITASDHTFAQSLIQDLFTSNQINVEQFKDLSQLFTKINLDNSVDKNVQSDISYRDKDKTLDLTDLTDLTNISESSSNKTAEQAVIVQNKPPSKKASQKANTSIDMVAKPDKGQNQHKNLDLGVTLKERFVLLERLGQGSMGVVFKAKDLLKVEARDKNPYVAIKVLTEAFKEYGGSFIALQREASKAQKLAHPNIATVYDFDRDGDIVFMTMEYLQGKPLNRLIKGLKDNPLSINEAIDIIENLSHGLAYAHQQNLIHSDFKPGNCFLLNDGTVKLLDFGIARAAFKPDEEKDNTLFDPSTLSAITPAYASIEMFSGMDLDPRDDIYGLACVAYQLLSEGRHPFNKVPAPKIKELGIKPKPINGLTRKQQKGLFKALSIERSNRTKSVQLFLEDIKQKKSYAKQIALSGMFVLIIVAGIAYKPFLNFQSEQAALDKVQLIKKGDRALLIETIWAMGQMDPEQQDFYSIGLRFEIITYYKSRIQAIFNPDKGLYNHSKAISLLNQVKRLYPDSVAITTIEEGIKEKKDRIMAQFISLYNQYLSNKKLLKSKDGLDITSVINVIKRLDPKHYILKDSKLSNLYLSEAENLISSDQYDLASEYIKTGLEFYPQHPLLLNLAQQLNIVLP